MTMRKLLAIFFFTTLFWLIVLSLPPSSSAQFGCRPPGYDPASDPDINLENWEEIIGAYLGIFEFDHPIDPNAPQFSSLIEGLCALDVTSVNMIDGTDIPPNVPADYGNLVCLDAPAGQSVLVPNSGYDMGGGCEAAVLYATPTSIVLKYTPDDNIISGYTVYLYNFNVDPELLAFYNEWHDAGRGQMPCLSGGERIGTSTGEICVAIRDTGTFMDPRWQEWWNQCPDWVHDLILRLINLCQLAPQSPSLALTCDPTFGGDRDSRPFGRTDNPPCDTCNQTRHLTSSCATGTTVSDIAWYQRLHNDEDGPGGEGPWCYGHPLIERPWGGTISVDVSDTEIPFVGKEYENENVGENVKLYLADYLDGTTEYYEGQNYPLYWLDGVDNTGVWRKLAPMAYQDQLKKEMVDRAIASLGDRIQEGKIHDYTVKYVDRLCWNAPFWITFLLNLPQALGVDVLSDIWKIADYCLYIDAQSLGGRIIDTALLNTVWQLLRNSPIDIPFHRWGDEEAQLSEFVNHLPPDPRETGDDYQELWEEWYREDRNLLEEKGRWAKLWEAVPMFSRENTPGFISPYIGQQPKDIFFVRTPDNLVEKVPHVARLYEVSQSLQNMLLPYFIPNLPSPIPTPPPVAQGPEDTLGKTQVALAASESQKEKDKLVDRSLESQVLGQKVYLAQYAPPDPIVGQGPCISVNPNATYSPSTGNVQVIVIYEKTTEAIGGIYIQPLVNGFNTTGYRYLVDTGAPWGLYPPWSPEFTLSPGECRDMSYGFVTWMCDEGQEFSMNCTFCVDAATGEFSTNCGGPVRPPGVDVTCLPFGTNPVGACNREGITDPNPNDDLCCDAIEVAFTGVDKFQNTDYCICGRCEDEEWGCAECEEVCDEFGQNCVTVIVEEHCDDCGSPLHPTSRQLGVGLSHPYLTEIWEQASRPETQGVFNFLKPRAERVRLMDIFGIFGPELPPFEDIDAKDELGYGYSDNTSLDHCPDDVLGNVSPGGGEFFYPHLGGVQVAKEWLTGMLIPNAERVSWIDILGL